MSAVVCGLDVHKESTYATVLDRDGQVLVQRKMHNEDIPAFLDMTKPEKLAMEASTYIIPLYRKLTENGRARTSSKPLQLEELMQLWWLVCSTMGNTLFP